MLDIPERINKIQSLMDDGSQESLIYAALEGRLTLEYICYERFKVSYSYLSEKDLNNWMPKNIVKQVSEDVNEYIDKEFTVAISASVPPGDTPTAEDYEKLDYTYAGKQSPLQLNKLHSYWHALSNVALHMPVPTIASGELNIYGDSEAIKKKLIGLIKFLSTMDGNILLGGHLGKTYSFECHECKTTVSKPERYLESPSVVSCINPKCHESYLISPSEYEKFTVKRMTNDFACGECGNLLKVPVNYFRDMRYKQQLNISCHSCERTTAVLMRPVVMIE